MENTVNSEFKPQISVFESLDSMASEFFDLVVNDFTTAVMNRRNYYIAFSGGNTPVLLFDKLAKIGLDKMNYDPMHVFWGDERCVPPDHPESNYGNAWNSILRYLDIPGQNIHRIKGEEDPDDERVRYEEILKIYLPVKNDLPRFDLILLGIGSDGHIASIFPDQMEVLESDSLCAVTKEPGTGHKRITLTGSVINNAKKILFLVTGKSKAEIVEKILRKGEGFEKLPASHISAQGTVMWYLDSEAAGKLKPEQ